MREESENEEEEEEDQSKLHYTLKKNEKFLRYISRPHVQCTH